MNQSFKKKALALSVAAAFAVAGGYLEIPLVAPMSQASANVFEASLANTYASTNKTVLRIGSTTPKKIKGFSLAESGTWNSSTSAPIAVRVVLPAGIDLYGATVNTATNSAGLNPSNVSSTLTAGTAVDIKRALHANSYVYVDGATTQYAIMGDDGAGIMQALNFANGVLANATGTTAATGLVTNNVASTVVLRKSTGTSLSTTQEKVGTVTKNSDGTTTLVLYVSAPDTSSSNNTIAVPDLVLGANSAATAGADISVQLLDTSGSGNALGITDATVVIGSFTSNLVAISGTASGTAVPQVTIGGVAGQGGGVVKVTFADKVTTVAGNKVTFSLDKGAKFKSGSTGVVTLAANGGTATISSGAVDASGNYVVTLAAGTILDGGSLDIAASTAYIDASAATAGDITLTATSADLTAFNTNTVKVATAAVKGTTVALNPTTATVPTIFTGRNAVTLASDFGTVTGVKVTETAAGTLLNSGDFTVTLDGGVKFSGTSALTDTSTGVDLTDITSIGSTTTQVSTVTTTVSAVSSGTAGSIILGGWSLDTRNATVGSLSMTLSGNAGATGTIKVADIKNATSYSTSGTLPTATTGSTVTLPDISIIESDAGAMLAANGALAISSAQVSTFDLTGATIKAYKADGTDVTSAILGTNVLSQNSTTTGTKALLFTVAAKSTSATGGGTGPVTLKISGVKAALASTASGNIEMTAAGANDLVPDLLTAANLACGTAAQLGSDCGAKLTKGTVKVAEVVSASIPTVPAATVTGTITSQNVSVGIVPAGNDLGKQGSVFVAAVIAAPSPYAGVYFMNSSKAWTVFSSCATTPAYNTGTLAAVSGVDLLPAASDLTVLKGTDIYVGYGAGGALSPAGTACTNMLNNGTYGKAYTIN